MRPALPCRYVPKHAAPREPLTLETRSALAVGLAAAMLPLGAVPAFADDAPTAATGTVTTSTATTSTATPAAATPAAQPASAPATPAATASPYAVGPGAPASAAAGPKAAPKREQRSSTSLSFTAPRSAKAKAVPVGIRLTADGRAVKDGYVRLEQSTSQGWTYVGRLLTGPDGVGKGTLKVAGSTKLRAAYTGSRVRTPAVSAPREVRTADVLGAAVLDEAAKHVGKPYVYGATGPDAFDCSGFTRYVYGQFGRSLPHNSRAQERVATPVSKADAEPGDLVFMQDVAGHVGIYAGDGRMYDAPRSGKSVSLRPIWSSNYTVGRVS